MRLRTGKLFSIPSISSLGALGGIILLSLVLRLIAALYQGNTVEILPGVHDQLSYHALACRVLEGHGFSFDTNWWPATRAGEPTAHWSFPYTLYLAGVYSVFGVNPLAGRLIQALLVGVLQPWLTWRIAKRIFSPRVALIAAAISALYAYFIYYAGALMTEAFYVVAILWVFDVAGRLQAAAGRSGGAARERGLWLSLGVALGLAVLLRQVFLLFVPFLLGWLILSRAIGGPVDRAAEHPRRRMPFRFGPIPTGGVLLALTVVVLLIAPWSVRNYYAFNQFVLLNTNAGFAFFWGNHPIHKTRFVPILPADGPGYVDLLPLELKGLNEAALDRRLLNLGIGFVRSDPVRYIRLSLSRVPEYFKFWPTRESGFSSNVIRVVSFGLILPFILIGLVQHLKEITESVLSHQSNRNLSSIPLILFAVIYSSIHFLSWTLVRYRIPVDGLMVMFAAFGFVLFLRLINKTFEQYSEKHLSSKPQGLL